jgi:hypothetical protein
VAVGFLIDGAAHSIAEGSFSFSRNMREPGRAVYRIRSTELAAVPGQQFKAYDSHGVAVFGGTNDEVVHTRISPQYNWTWQDVTVVSWESRLTKRYCGPKVYFGMNAGAIVTDLVNSVNEGILTTGEGFISPGASAEQIGTITFVGLTVWEALLKLQDLSGYVTYVDPEIFLHFGPLTGVETDIVFNASNNNFHDPVITENRADYANRIKLSISFDAFSPIEDTATGDGTAQEFDFEDESSQPIAIEQVLSVELDGVPNTFGLRSEIATADWTFEYGGSTLYQNPDDPPIGAGQELKIIYHPIGGNIIEVEDTAEIAQRQSIEDYEFIGASGVYELMFEDSTIATAEAGETKALSLLKAHCPHANGAPLGYLPKQYKLSARGYIGNADKLQPGGIVTLNTTAPNSGGDVDLLIETVSATITGCGDPANSMEPGGWLLYELTLTKYSLSQDVVDYFRGLTGQASSSSVVQLPGETDGSGLSPLPHAVLGVAKVIKKFAPEDGTRLLAEVTIPVTFAAGVSGDVDRLIVYNQAPDNADAPPALVGEDDGDVGIVVSDDADTVVVTENNGFVQVAEFEYNSDLKFVRFDYPAPTATQFWRTKVVSASKEIHNRIEDSPSVRYEVTPKSPDPEGNEYAPNAETFFVINNAAGQPVTYSNIQGGAPVWEATLGWTNNPYDPKAAALGGYDLVFEYTSGRRAEAVSGISANLLSIQIGPYTLGETGDIILYLVPWSNAVKNPRNTIVYGVTKHVILHIEQPLGPPGGEHAPLVRNFRIQNPFYRQKGDGSYDLVAPARWDDPVTNINFGGGVVFMVRADTNHYKLTGVEVDNGEDCVIENTPSAPEPGVFFYCLSVDKGLNINEYEPGVTPQTEVFTLQPPPTTQPPVSAFLASVVYAKDEFGNNVYGYTGTWLKPNTEQYPGYAGVKIYIGNAAGGGFGAAPEAKALTGIETKQSFITDKWPVVVASGMYLFAVTVDVYNKEAPIATSPRVGPLFITAQGGTITNAALPDLNVSDFAAGIEPVKLVGAIEETINVGGVDYKVLPASFTKTSIGVVQVHNTTNDTGYRWVASLNRYKKIAGIGDMEFNSVTATFVAASAITAGKIAAGAVRSIEMATNELLVGPTPGAGGASTDRPPLVKINDGSGSMVALIGSYLGWQGGYFLNLRVGPNFASPLMECDNLGLRITNANFSVVALGSTSAVEISPAYFDPTYAVLALKATDNSGATTNVVSRGIVVYNNNVVGTPQKVASLNRHPFNPTCGELVLYASGIITIRMDALNGLVVANQYQVGGVLGHTGPTTRNIMLVGGGSFNMQVAGGIVTLF